MRRWENPFDDVGRLRCLRAIENRALTLDRDAVIRIVSSFRLWRQASERLLASRYRDGECDAVAIGSFELALLSVLDIIEDGEKEIGG